MTNNLQKDLKTETVHDQNSSETIACSKRSDSGERCHLSSSLAFIFFAPHFTSQRSPLSERLEQAT